MPAFGRPARWLSPDPAQLRQRPKKTLVEHVGSGDRRLPDLVTKPEPETDARSQSVFAEGHRLSQLLALQVRKAGNQSPTKALFP